MHKNDAPSAQAIVSGRKKPIVIATVTGKPAATKQLPVVNATPPILRIQKSQKSTSSTIATANRNLRSSPSTRSNVLMSRDEEENGSEEEEQQYEVESFEEQEDTQRDAFEDTRSVNGDGEGSQNDDNETVAGFGPAEFEGISPDFVLAKLLNVAEPQKGANTTLFYKTYKKWSIMNQDQTNNTVAWLNKLDPAIRGN